MHAVVFLLLGLVLLSTLQAQDMPAAVTTATRYASFVGLFFVVSQAVRTRTELTRLVWVLSISASAAGAIATYRFLSGQATIATLAHGDPNDVAFALATTLPLTLWLVRRPGWQRAAALTMCVVILGSIALTFSRGALLGLGVAVLWQAIVQRRHVGVIVLGALVGLLGLLVISHLEPSQVQKGLTYKTNIAQENVSSRLEAWGAAAHLSADHPLLGVGPGNFRVHYLQATGRPLGTPPLAVVHDAYLDIAAELGPLAAVAFVLYLALCFARLTEARRTQTGPPGFATALRLSLIVGMVAALTLSEQYFAPFWLIGGLAAGLHLQRRATKPTR
jgi:O-antigen ligase